METTIRPARTTDAAECGRIIYAAFTDIADRHGPVEMQLSSVAPPQVVAGSSYRRTPEAEPALSKMDFS
jgi:hypothetical protein